MIKGVAFLRHKIAVWLPPPMSATSTSLASSLVLVFAVSSRPTAPAIVFFLLAFLIIPPTPCAKIALGIRVKVSGHVNFGLDLLFLNIFFNTDCHWWIQKKRHQAEKEILMVHHFEEFSRSKQNFSRALFGLWMKSGWTIQIGLRKYFTFITNTDSLISQQDVCHALVRPFVSGSSNLK